MGVICKKCGTENSYTSLFCVNCGEKLELENMSVEAMSKTPFSWKKLFGKIWKVTSIVLKCAVAIVIIALFVPAGGGKARLGEPDVALKKKIAGLCEGKADNKAKEVVLTDSEIGGLIKEKYKSQLTGKSFFGLRIVGIHIMEGNVVQATLRYKLFDFVPWDARVKYLMEVKEYPAEEKDKPAEKQLDFTLQRIYLGRLPMPMFVSRLLADKSDKILQEDEELTKLRMHIASVKTELLPYVEKPAEKPEDKKPEEDKPEGKKSLKAATAKENAKPAPQAEAKPATKPAAKPAKKPAAKKNAKNAKKAKQTLASKAVKPIKKAQANKAAKEAMVEQDPTTAPIEPAQQTAAAPEKPAEKPAEPPVEIKVEEPKYPEGKLTFTLQ